MMLRCTALNEHLALKAKVHIDAFAKA